MVTPRNWFAEAIATYALVFFGPLAVILSVVAFGDGLSIEAIIMIALGHGGAIGLMVYAFGHVSGAHINPAVTIPMMITKKISVGDGIGYIIFQLIGATLAAFSLKAILPEIGSKVNFATQGGPSELLNNSVMAALTVEIIFTFFLVTVIFLTAVHKKAPAGIHGISIGGMVFLLHLVGVPLTGASMNPARTFGPALASGFWEFHWIYWVAPIIGGIIAGVIMNYIFVKNAETPKEDRKQAGSDNSQQVDLETFEKGYIARVKKKGPISKKIISEKPRPMTRIEKFEKEYIARVNKRQKSRVKKATKSESGNESE